MEADGDDEQVGAVVHQAHADNDLHQIVLGHHAVKAQHDQRKGADKVDKHHSGSASFPSEDWLVSSSSGSSVLSIRMSRHAMPAMT